MFTILIKAIGGWSDNLGPGQNTWDTHDEAEAACAELRKVWPAPEFKIVPTADLGNYDLIA
jgi:hypothetical protein